MFKKILVAIDLTESQMTMQAIDKAGALARAFNSELRLVNVRRLSHRLPRLRQGKFRKGYSARP